MQAAAHSLLFAYPTEQTYDGHDYNDCFSSQFFLIVVYTKKCIMFCCLLISVIAICDHNLTTLFNRVVRGMVDHLE